LFGLVAGRRSAPALVFSSHGREWPRKLTETLQFHNRAGDRILTGSWGRRRPYHPGRWDTRGTSPGRAGRPPAVRAGLSAKPRGIQPLGKRSTVVAIIEGVEPD